MTAKKSNEYITAKAQKSGVAFVELWAVDLAGRLRGLTVPSAQLESVFEDGAPVAAETLGGAGDDLTPLILAPDPATWSILPVGLSGAPAVARMFCDVLRADGSPYACDARGALKRAIGRASDQGYTFYAGIAVEHYLLASPRHGATSPGAAPEPLVAHLGRARGYASTPAEHELMLGAIAALERLGIAVRSVAFGAGPSQLRFDLAYADALTVADALVTHRRVVCDLARAQGLGATFMPFPYADAPGSALDVTLSLLDAGEPLFYEDPRAGDGSAFAQQLASGLEAAGPALSLLCRGTVNSYSRPASPAARVLLDAHAAGEDGAALRFVGADASANPHLLLAALLGACLLGVRGELATPAGRAAPPVTLVQAAQLAADTPWLQDCLGRELLSALVARAQSDSAAFRRQVTPWELARYLDAH